MSVAVDNNYIVNVLRIYKEKNSAWLKSIAQVKRFTIGILRHKCTVKRPT